MPRYPEDSAQSRALYERGSALIPGGNTRQSLFYPPYPLYASHAAGCRVVDADGVERLDFVNCNTATILGYGHPALVEAIQAQVVSLSSIGMPTAGEIDLAALILQRLPGMDLVRFANSGTEAMMFAVRAARAFTGRHKIAKVEGAYHGSYDPLFVSIRPTPDVWGPASAPASVPHSAGLPASALEDVVVFPANALEETRELIARHAADLACVVIDPMIAYCGYLPLRRDYIQMVRELTAAHGIVLVFDEILSFRLGFHGAQGVLDIAPDLTALGKVVGGGLPIGVLAGTRPLMDLFDHSGGKPRVEQSGTFSGNPLTMAAGCAVLRELTPIVIERLTTLGERLREGLQRTLWDAKIPSRVVGASSLAGVLFTNDEFSDYRGYYGAMSKGGWARARAFHHALLNAGVSCGPGAGFSLSTPMTAADIDECIARCASVLMHLAM